MFKTDFCRLLNIDLPVGQAPIGNATSPALAAAVSNAGGLGMLGMTWRQLDDVRHLIRETRRLSDRPFGVNLVLQWPPDKRLAVCLEEGIKLVSLTWGDPAPYVNRVHAAGGLVMHTVGSADEARRVVDAGVDIVVAQGWEAGGHVWSEVATLPLVPRVVDAVAPRPVVAAGGIADGRGLAAALALGASGVWIGTRFLASREAVVHPVYQKRVVEGAETGTVYSRLFDGGWPDAPHRTLRNSTVLRWEEAGQPPSGRRPGEGEVIATSADGRTVERYHFSTPFPGMTGEMEGLALYAGQSVGLVSQVEAAGEIVKQIAQEAAAVLGRCARLV